MSEPTPGNEAPENLPRRDQEESEEAAKRSREAIEKVPEPGTDPLHEGP